MIKIKIKNTEIYITSFYFQKLIKKNSYFIVIKGEGIALANSLLCFVAKIEIIISKHIKKSLNFKTNTVII